MNVFSLLFEGFPDTVFQVFCGLAPIVAIFFVLRLAGMAVGKREMKRIVAGFAIAFAGLVLFMQGVHIAFLPVGTYIGQALGAMENNWILVPLGFLMGFLVAFAEPAVHVMIKQVEDLTSGTIKAKFMLLAISLGVAVAVAIAMVKLLTGLSLWWFLVPGYIIVFILAKFCPPIFVAMAFDNGGVATGPMCSTFILAMSLAIASVIPGRNPMLDGFGIVALIAMAPILTTMLLGFLYKTQSEKTEKEKMTQNGE